MCRSHSNFCKSLLSLAAVAIALTFAVPSQDAEAATFDFAALATPGAPTGGNAPFGSGVGEGTWNALITGGGFYGVGSITVSASASHAAGSTATSLAYLDAPLGPGSLSPAGLGVCSTAGGCA